MARSTGSDLRLQELLVGFTKHLHHFVREVELTDSEWTAAIQFLTAAAKISDDQRQEFILLSDVLGLSILVDAINHRKLAGATESTVFCPFWLAGASEVPPRGIDCSGRGSRIRRNDTRLWKGYGRTWSLD